MLTIVTYWESSQMPAALEWRMWRQLRGAFNINRFIFTPVVHDMDRVGIVQAPSMEEALELVGGSKIFLEPTGLYDLNDADVSAIWTTDSEVAVVLGNTEHSNAHLVDKHGGMGCFIKSPGDTDMYGINAAAIALAHWYGQ